MLNLPKPQLSSPNFHQISQNCNRYNCHTRFIEKSFTKQNCSLFQQTKLNSKIITLRSMFTRHAINNLFIKLDKGCPSVMLPGVKALFPGYESR